MKPRAAPPALLPCPHCHCTGLVIVEVPTSDGQHRAWVACTSPGYLAKDGTAGCGAGGPVTTRPVRKDAVEAAVAAWNDRTP